MKESNKIISISAAMVAFVAIVGLSLVSYAQSDDTTTATTNFQGRNHARLELTEEERVQMQTDREERMAEQEASRDAINTAIDQGYDAWVAAVKEYRGEDAVILDQVNESNFATFVEAHGYMTQAHELTDKARTTLENAGINMPGRGGMGHGKMGGQRGGFNK